MANNSKRAVYYEQAEELYVKRGLSLQVIEGMLEGEVTRRTLSNWNLEFKWNVKREKYLASAKGLEAKAKKLVELAYNNAEANPNAKNMAAFQRAVSTLKLLQSISVIEKQEADDDKSEGLTKEKALQIRKEVLGF